MYLTGKLENGRREKKKNKIGSYHIALLSFQLPPPPRMFPKHQEYNLAVSLYYVIAISLFPLTLRFSNREEKNPSYIEMGGEGMLR